MDAFAELILLFFFVAAASAGLAWLLTRGTRPVALPAPDAVIRLRGESGMYRVRFLGAESGGWALSAPLRRDSYVPVRVGEEFLVDAPVAGGAVLFRAKVIDRAQDPHRLVISGPEAGVRPRDRRGARRQECDGERARIGPFEADLLDVSATGARMRVNHGYACGDYVEIEVRGSRSAGYVVDSQIDGPCDRRVVRVAFGERP